MASINRINDELLRRIESLENKVSDLQIRNEGLEKMLKDSFIGFKFNKEDRTNRSNNELNQEARMDVITRILRKNMGR